MGALAMEELEGKIEGLESLSTNACPTHLGFEQVPFHDTMATFGQIHGRTAPPRVLKLVIRIAQRLHLKRVARSSPRFFLIDFFFELFDALGLVACCGCGWWCSGWGERG
jgi:hypothetical protein